METHEDTCGHMETRADTWRHMETHGDTCGLVLMLHRVDQNRIYTPYMTVYTHRIYTPYMTVYLVISLPKIPYIQCIHMVLANPTHVATWKNM
jgi:hypothetical protein